MSRKLQIAAEKAIAKSLRTEPQRWTVERKAVSHKLNRDDGLRLHIQSYSCGSIYGYIDHQGQCFSVIKVKMLDAALCYFMRPISKAKREAEEAALKTIVRP